MISIIIPVYNAEKTIGKCLSSFLNQNYPKRNYEIICVDDGSTDKTRDTIKKFKKVKLISTRHRGPALARNLGVKKSKGKIIMFTDADCVPDKKWIRNMVNEFKNKEIVGVAGTYKTLNKEKLIARFVGYEIEERHKKLKKYIDFVGTYSAAYRKDIFSKFGGFDTSFPIASGEDTELSFKINKAGYKIIFQPKAFVYHRHPDYIWRLIKQKFWRGYWRVFVYKKHKDKMLTHSYTPKSLFIEIAITGIAFFLLLLGMLGIISLFYGLAFLTLTFLLTLPFSFKVFCKDKPVGILSPFIIIIRNFFTGIGIAYGLFRSLIEK